MNKEAPQKRPVRRTFFGELSWLALPLIAFFVLQEAISVALALLPPSPLRSMLSAFSIPLLYLVGIGVVSCLFLAAWKQKPTDVVNYRPGRRLKHPVLLALASLTAVQLTGAAASLIFTALGGNGNGALTADALPSSLPEYIPFFVNVVLLPALFEEALCRGLVLKRLLPYGRRKAIFVSALIFALLHGTPVAMLYAFVCGLIYGNVALKTGSTLSTTLLHAMQNGVSFLLLLLLSVIHTPDAMTIAGLIVFVSLFVGMVCGCILFAFWLEKRLSFPLRRRLGPCLPKGNFLASAGFWLFVLFALFRIL